MTPFIGEFVLYYYGFHKGYLQIIGSLMIILHLTEVILPDYIGSQMIIFHLIGRNTYLSQFTLYNRVQITNC